MQSSEPQVKKPDSGACTWEGCSKPFSRKSDLQRHYRTHTNERPYPCIFANCGKKFKQQSALTVHICTHTGEKPHACPYEGCESRFADSSSLARHRRIHSGVRPFKCKKRGCGRTFCRKPTLMSHLRKAHRQESQAMEDVTDDYDTGPDPGNPPHTPSRQTGATWPSQAVSPDDHSQQEGYHMSSDYHRQPSMPMVHMNHSPDVHVMSEAQTMPSTPIYIMSHGSPSTEMMSAFSHRPRVEIPNGMQEIKTERVETANWTPEFKTERDDSPSDMSAMSYHSSSFRDASSPEDPYMGNYERQLGPAFDNTHGSMGMHSHPAMAPGYVHQVTPLMASGNWSEYSVPITPETMGHMNAIHTTLNELLFMGEKKREADPSLQLPSARLDDLIL